MAGHRLGLAGQDDYRGAIESMKSLNREGARLMQAYSVRSATDITGFGLLGHALKMAKGSGVSMRIVSARLPLLPGACFRNQESAADSVVFDEAVEYTLRMAMFDAQTSGGLLIAATEIVAEPLLDSLRKHGYPASAIIGEVIDRGKVSVHVR